MRKDSTIPVEHIIADSFLSSIGYIEPDNSNRHSTLDESNKRISGIIKAHSWQNLTALWEQESKASQEFRDIRSNFDYYAENRMLAFILTADVIGYLAIVKLVIVFFIIGVLAWLLLKISRRLEPVPEISRWGKIGLAILALLPWLVITGMSAYMTMLSNGGG